MDKYRCTAPSCEFIANSVKIAYSHKEETGHTLERMGTESRPSPAQAVGFGQAVMTEGWFRHFLTFTDDGQHGQMVAAIKEQMKLWGRKATAASSAVSTREVIKEVVLIQCRS